MQTVAGKVNILGLTFTLAFGSYLLFGAGYIDNAFIIFFGPVNLEITKTAK